MLATSCPELGKSLPAKALRSAPTGLRTGFSTGSVDKHSRTASRAHHAHGTRASTWPQPAFACFCVAASAQLSRHLAPARPSGVHGDRPQAHDPQPRPHGPLPVRICAEAVLSARRRGEQRRIRRGLQRRAGAARSLFRRGLRHGSAPARRRRAAVPDGGPVATQAGARGAGVRGAGGWQGVEAPDSLVQPGVDARQRAARRGQLAVCTRRTRGSACRPLGAAERPLQAWQPCRREHAVRFRGARRTLSKSFACAALLAPTACPGRQPAQDLR